MAGCLGDAAQSHIQFTVYGFQVFPEGQKVAGITGLRAVGIEVAVGNAAEYGIHFRKHCPESFHKLGSGVGQDAGLVPGGHLGKRAFQVPLGEGVQAVCAFDNGPCKRAAHGSGDQNHQNAEHDTHRHLDIVARIGVAEKLVFTDGDAHAPTVRARNGGIALDVVRIVSGVGISSHAFFPGNHLLLNGAKCLYVLVVGIGFHFLYQVFLVQYFFCLQSGNGSTFLI